jgi:Flp pilus assembly protein TadD
MGKSLSRKTVKRRVHANQLLDSGNRLYLRGDLTGAAKAYQQYLSHYPSDKHAHYNLAVTLTDSQPAAALASFQNALQLDPFYPEALNNLGILLHSQGHLDAARQLYARAISARPGYEDAEYNFATAESNAGRYPEAIFGFSRILERNPQHVDAWNNLGTALLAIRQPAEASQAFRMALQLRPDFQTALWNWGVAQLTLGNLKDGWAGFEHRSLSRHAASPRWDGSDLAGKRLLVHAEQGLGDTIQFIRYCPPLRTMGGHVVFECPPELRELFNNLEGVDTFVPRGTDLPQFDCQVPLLSLPLVFGTTLETIPYPGAYLHAEPALTAKWRARLDTSDCHLKVGLVWAGNPNHRNDRNRSIDPKVFAAALGQPDDVSFYCLQQRPQSEAVADMSPIVFKGIFDNMTFVETAAIIANLDLVISVDTAVAHLAGALGRPVWTLLPYAPDWRWMLDRSDTPWYPTMRLFRQPKLSDWAGVLAQVAAELKSVARGPRTVNR